MAFLQPSDFDNRPYRIPNQQESTDLEAFIQQAEKDLLICLLGYALYTEFSANVDTSGAESRWVNLRDGAEYVYDNKTYKYNGIVLMLKPAVYSLWIDPGTYKFTNVGYVQNNAPKESRTMGEEQEPFRVNAWNNYIKQAYDNGNRKNTWYGYMKANESDYPTWEFDKQAECVEYQNRFSL